MEHFKLTRRIYLLVIALLTAAMLTLTAIAIAHNIAEGRRLDAESVALRENLTIGYGEDAHVSDFLTHLNGILVADPAIDTSELGRREITFDYINVQNHRRRVDFAVEVIDTTPPVIYATPALTLPVGSTARLTDILLSVDDLDDHPTREIVGDYDLNRIGTYALTYRVTDASGNTAEQLLLLRVVAPTENTSPTPRPDPLSIAEVIAQHKTADTAVGIDVSSWQGEIDWPAVKAAGVEFAFVRIGYQAGYGGELVLDRYFEANISGAEAVGLPVGVYLYSAATSVDEARAQAAWVAERLAPYTATLGVAFDWESWSDFNLAGVSLRTLNRSAEVFLDYFATRGYRTFLYGSKNYLDRFWRLDTHETWLAQYYDRPTYTGDWTLWQLGDYGRVDGIAGDVDLDLLRLDR